MTAKITLITPPDIFQNDQESVLFFDLSSEEQDSVIQWLTKNDLTINIYFYQGEVNIPWLLHSLSCSTYKYVNIDNMSAVTSHMSSYILAKNNVFYSTKDVNISELYSYINNNRVTDAVDFLKKVFSVSR